MAKVAVTKAMQINSGLQPRALHVSVRLKSTATGGFQPASLEGNRRNATGHRRGRLTEESVESILS
jgi:hypothetical protein